MHHQIDMFYLTLSALFALFYFFVYYGLLRYKKFQLNGRLKKQILSLISIYSHAGFNKEIDKFLLNNKTYKIAINILKHNSLNEIELDSLKEFIRRHPDYVYDGLFLETLKMDMIGNPALYYVVDIICCWESISKEKRLRNLEYVKYWHHYDKNFVDYVDEIIRGSKK